MRNMFLTFFATSTFFLAIAAFMQADRTMVINAEGIQEVGYSQADRDSLNEAIVAYQVQQEGR